MKEFSATDKKVKKSEIIAFCAVLIAVCIAVGFVSGAAGSYFVYRFFDAENVEKVKKSSTENVFVPEYYSVSEQSTENSSRDLTALPQESEDETVSPGETQLQEPETAKQTKTKSEIYASAVNSIVLIETKYEEVRTGLFGRTQKREYTSSGSGFFVSDDGYIVTNYHVIENAEAVSVKTYDGKTHTAKITGFDKTSDIAVLKIKGHFVPVEAGDSSTLEVGDEVLVIGNALGELTYTFTDGVVSFLNRSVSTGTGAVINMFQTNAAINEGNSGGPVYNSDGKAVGIASAKYTSSSVEGLGFCIPLNDALPAVFDIIEYGYVKNRPLLGVSVQTVSAAMSYAYNLPDGCYIAAVGENTAAQKAGLKEGFVITAADGKKTTSTEELSIFLSAKKAGDTVKITATHGGEVYDFAVVLDEKKPSEPRTEYSNVTDL